MEGVHSSVGDCWKGLRIRSTPKCLWNLEESEECQRCPRLELEKLRDVFGAENRLSPDKEGLLYAVCVEEVVNSELLSPILNVPIVT